MFRWLTRAPRRVASSSARKSRLVLEALEDRYCLSNTITSFSSLVLTGHQAKLSGTVQDPHPTTDCLTFSGAASGTTHPDSSGNFSWTTSAASLGSVSVSGIDQDNASSNTYTISITKTAPAVTLSISYGSGKTVTLSGHVTDLDLSGRTLTFTGMATGSVQTNSDGTYTYTTQASALGTISASTVDLWSQTSNTAQVNVTRDAPTMTSFTARQAMGTTWVFSGNVTDASPSSAVVTLSGTTSVQGKTVTVQSDGSFSISILLGQGETGTESAKATNIWSLDSNVMTADVT